jgi:hypothetical protein
MIYTPAEQAIIDRYLAIDRELMAGYRLADQEGLGNQQACQLADLEADRDALYDQLPQALRDEWNA